MSVDLCLHFVYLLLEQLYGLLMLIILVFLFLLGLRVYYTILHLCTHLFLEPLQTIHLIFHLAQLRLNPLQLLLQQGLLLLIASPLLFALLH